MRRALFILPFAVAVFVAGCDSSDDTVTLDNSFYVGSWNLVSVSDDSGDRTSDIRRLVQNLDVTFNSAGTFDLDVDFSDIVNSTGQADRTLSGTYQATTTALALVLQGVSPRLAAAATTRDRVSLTASSAVVSQLLGGQVPIESTGDVTLVIQRQ